MRLEIRFIISLLILISSALSAMEPAGILDGIPEEAVSALNSTGEVFRLDRNHRGVRLAPDVPQLLEMKKRTAGLNPDVFTEALYLIPYPPGTDGVTLDIYNLTRRVSAISKVIYLSSRRKDYVPLFDDVYAVSDARKKSRINDPLVDSIPSRESILIHMDEINLGSAIYRVDYLWDGETLAFFMTNLDPLRAIIKVVDSENMQFSIIFIPTDKGFLVYGACGVRLSNADTVYRMMDPYTGFYRRLYALVIWIYNTMHNTDRLPELKKPLDF